MEFVGRADGQVVTNVVCFRSLPDPLGIVLWRGKLKFVEFSVHCEPVRFPGVAIPRIDALLLVDKFRKTVQKNGLYDDRQLEIRRRFPHQCAHWFGMTVFFDARSFLAKFQFLVLLR